MNAVCRVVNEPPAVLKICTVPLAALCVWVLVPSELPSRKASSCAEVSFCCKTQWPTVDPHWLEKEAEVEVLRLAVRLLIALGLACSPKECLPPLHWNGPMLSVVSSFRQKYPNSALPSVALPELTLNVVEKYPVEPSLAAYALEW